MRSRLTIKYKTLWEILFLSLLFLYIYSPRFIFIGGTTKIFIIMILFYFAIKPKIILEYFKSKTMVNISYFLLFISVLTLVVPLIYGTYDFSFSKYFITALIVNLPITFFFIHIFRNKISLDFNSIVKYLFILSFIQAIFILLNWFVPSVKQFVVNLLVFSFDAENYYRATGISYGTGDGLSFIQAIGFMTGFYTLFQEKKNFYKNIIFLSIIFISMVFIGRTGMMLSLLFAGIYSVLLFRHRFVSIMKLFIFSIFLMIGFGLITQYLITIDMTRILSWAFEFYFSYIESGNIETSSTNALMDMYFLPTNEISILFGEGYYANPHDSESNYIHSDSGYIRTIFFGGLLTMGVVLAYYIYLIFIFKKLTNKNEFMFILLLFLIYFIGHLKIGMLYYGTNMRIIFILLIVSYFAYYKKIKYTNHNINNKKRN